MIGILMTSKLSSMGLVDETVGHDRGSNEIGETRVSRTPWGPTLPGNPGETDAYWDLVFHVFQAPQPRPPIAVPTCLGQPGSRCHALP
jgi:hypothetical protein